jgi:hypothetical protein
LAESYNPTEFGLTGGRRPGETMRVAIFGALARKLIGRPESGVAAEPAPTATAASEAPAMPPEASTGGLHAVAAADANRPRSAFPAPASGPPARQVTPAIAAAEFVAWGQAHGLADREWPVDDVWFLASRDFAPAQGVTLPPRRVFLGALQRQPGVAVAYDRRVYARDGRLKGKTTVYRLPTIASAAADHPPTMPTIAAPPLRRAA